MRFSVVILVLLAAATSSTVRGQTPAPAVPPAFDLMEQSIEALQKAMADKQVTSRQLVEIYLARIDAYDQRGPALNAIIAINPQARAAADALDAERVAKGPRGPLHGIPVLVKDNYETIEMPTTAGSIALATYHPQRDAFMVRQLKEAGAVILGKTTMHELAAGIYNGRARASDRRRTRMTSIARLADRAAAPVRRSPRTSRPRAWAATPVDRFAFPPGTTTW